MRSHPWLPSVHGWYVGTLVGTLVGDRVGARDGSLVGDRVLGALVGDREGAGVKRIVPGVHSVAIGMFPMVMTPDPTAIAPL